MSALLGRGRGDEAPARSRDGAAAGGHGAAAHERANDPPAQRASRPGGGRGAGAEGLGREDGLAAEVGERKVGVGVRLDPALAGEAEAGRRRRGGEGRDPLEREPALVVAGVEHDSEERLAADDAAPYREEVLALL